MKKQNNENQVLVDNREAWEQFVAACVKDFERDPGYTLEMAQAGAQILARRKLRAQQLMAQKDS
ncbi:hypothetical protein SCB71_15510 [Herbiconiux sp. KACC 21604]|uniref:hypothetical protein n=1 Tax=unclassified Herbiconiux TaxID=2618217 RepID=UPI0014916615|nr:hypothetical protein [Herbiconiux sp. SALV-R1]QJU54534.1 hypothetical protein HL652_13455 [Herbiconiux sp. SALV-R1]WPO85617.1 hypothetical protein SCB71_15510 [Herbiconiux sp. KACC 21604]